MRTTILAVVVLLLTSIPCYAVDWASLPYSDFRTLQTVDANGNATYPANGFPVKLLGIVLNDPAAMANSTANSQSIPFNLSPIWQVFVQTVDVNASGDFGGVAVFAAQNYGNVPPNLTFPGGIPTPDPGASYNNAAWDAEVARISSNGTLKAGDRVEIQAQGGLSFGGKFNINEQHQINPNTLFNLVIQSPGSLPTPTPLHIADVWDQINARILFDPTRAAGGEKYQSTLVRLQDVQLLSGQAANWTSNAVVTVADLAGRQLAVQLGTNPAFSPANAPTGFFDVTGIFNQEAGSAGPFTQGYQVWVMDPNSVTPVPEPATFALAMIGIASILVVGRRNVIAR